MASRSSRTKRTSPTAQTMAGECLAARVRLINRAITGMYDELLRPHGLRVSQMSILVAVTCRGLVKPTDLGRGLCLEKSTLSRNVDRMVHMGWLEVAPGEDGRSQQLRITAKGKRLLAKAAPAWRQAQRKARAILGEQGATAVHDIAQMIPGSAFA